MGSRRKEARDAKIPDHRHDAALEEVPLSRETIYRGRIIELALYTVRLPNGKTAPREVVHHPGAVAVLAVVDDARTPRIVLVRQYRLPLGRVTLEIPAGKREPGSAPLDDAKRELLEETGFTARSWRSLGVFYSSPGFADEAMHFYEAKDLTPGAARPDNDEFVDLVLYTLDEAKAAAARGEICDLKTMFALTLWENAERNARRLP